MASLTLDPVPAVQPSDAGSGVNDGLSTAASGQKVIYCGIPARGNLSSQAGIRPVTWHRSEAAPRVHARTIVDRRTAWENRNL